MCRAHVRCTSVATRVSCIEPPVSTLYTMRGGVASAAPASQRSGCDGKDGSTEGSGVSGIAAGSDGADSWTSGGVVGMTRCCTGATNKCAASRRPAAATTKRVATARIIVVRVRRSARRGERTSRRSSTDRRSSHASVAPTEAAPRRGALALRTPPLALRALVAVHRPRHRRPLGHLRLRRPPRGHREHARRRRACHRLRGLRRRCTRRRPWHRRRRARTRRSLGCADRKLAAWSPARRPSAGCAACASGVRRSTTDPPPCGQTWSSQRDGTFRHRWKCSRQHGSFSHNLRSDCRPTVHTCRMGGMRFASTMIRLLR